MPAAIASELIVRPLADAIGAEILGVDLRHDLPDELFEQIRETWYAYQVILMRGQNITEEQQIRLGERFGPLAAVHLPEVTRHHPAVMLISNVREGGRPIGALPDGEMQFHSDQCYQARPSQGTMLYAIEIPSRGGDTLFANAYKAYETLPPEIKARVDRLRAVNIYDYDRNPTRRGTDLPEDAPRFSHPAVRTHPVTKRKALYVNRLMTARLEGVAEDEGRRLLEFLFAHLERSEFVYQHIWRPGDLLLWDNRCTLHARTDFDASERRLLRRITLKGEPVT